jgi:hypothetical protein
MERNYKRGDFVFEDCEFSALAGEVIEDIDVEEYAHRIFFRCKSGKLYCMWDCTDYGARAWVEEVIGDVEDVVNSKVVLAEEVCNEKIQYVYNYKLPTGKRIAKEGEEVDGEDP